MKRSALLLSSALIAALLLMGCPTDPETSIMDNLSSSVDYTVTAGTNLSLDGTSLVLTADTRYVAALGGIACTFAADAGQYADAFVISLADVDGLDSFSTVEVVADLYEGETLVDLTSEYPKRVYGKVDNGGDGANYNMGVVGETLDISTAVTSLNFGRKVTTATLLVIKSVTFAD